MLRSEMGLNWLRVVQWRLRDADNFMTVCSIHFSRSTTRMYHPCNTFCKKYLYVTFHLTFSMQITLILSRIFCCGYTSLTQCSAVLCVTFHWYDSLPWAQKYLCLPSYDRKLHHHHPWIRSFDLFRHRRIAIVSWGVHDLFFRDVCSWGRVSAVLCCPFFQGGLSSFVCIWVSRLVFQRSLILFLWLRFLFYPALCIP